MKSRKKSHPSNRKARMARQDDIEDLLRRVSRPFLKVAREAQTAAAELGNTDWGRRHLVRRASANQVSGTARRRIACDLLVARQDEFDGLLEVTTSDSEHNQGRYYLRSTDVAALLTVRRKPHEEDDQPAALQLQFDHMRELVTFADEIVVYLAIPPLGEESRFEIATRGQELIVHRLVDLIDRDDDEDSNGITRPFPGARLAPPVPAVRSTIVPEVEEDNQDDRG
jgi:hypothetical protein